MSDNLCLDILGPSALNVVHAGQEVVVAVGGVADGADGAYIILLNHTKHICMVLA